MAANDVRMRRRLVIALALTGLAVAVSSLVLAQRETKGEAPPAGTEALACLRAASFSITVRRTRVDGTPLGIDAQVGRDYVATIFFARTGQEAQRWKNHLQIEESNAERLGLNVVHWGVVSKSRRSTVERCLA